EQTLVAGPQRGLEEAPGETVSCVFLSRRSEGFGLVEGGGQIADGVAARAEDGDPPARPGPGHGAAVEGRDQPGADQGRLAAPRGAEDGQEAGGAQPPEELVDLPLAAEEEVVLIRLERPQSRERMNTGDRPGWRDHALALRWRTISSRKGASTPGEKPVGSSRRIWASRVRNPSFCGVWGAAR